MPSPLYPSPLEVKRDQDDETGHRELESPEREGVSNRFMVGSIGTLLRTNFGQTGAFIPRPALNFGFSGMWVEVQGVVGSGDVSAMATVFSTTC